MIISCSDLVTMRNIADKFVEKITAPTLCLTTFLHNRAVYENVWEKYGRTGYAIK